MAIKDVLADFEGDDFVTPRIIRAVRSFNGQGTSLYYYSVAEAEADSAFLQLSQVTSSERASQWYAGLLQVIESLSQMPSRCSLARENDYFSQEIRQIL
ncbi:MAG: hypothetical protein RM022_015120 [Nostoc sp. EfeVER01]|uniref:hypothetical protein n=1 Tax=unclassified Nostoc TaxID=2593658 RepID=UPI002AD51DB7|nr:MULTISPECIES: hypothetical protein [unclassified Nostoc]MDZ7946146.1 hypothetical protein [Nostoc sp. EfeVER01]MDZ7992103.1 hypothetical protein [Nostoc sp. EspVER01]